MTAVSKTILVLGPRADQVGPLLREAFPTLDIRVRPSIGAAGDDIAAAHVIICNGPSFNEDIIGRARNLEWVQALTSGVDGILACRNLGPDVLVTSARGIHGPQMSELTFLHMLALVRNYPRMLQNQRQRAWRQWSSPVLLDKTVVVLGVGAIAGAFAPRCKAFGMTVYGISSAPRHVPGFDRIFPRKDMLEAVAAADFLVIFVPLSPETERLVDASVLTQLKPTAFLINMARGGVIDEAALIDALRHKRIAGAALDVFSTEPLPQDSPLWTMDNVIISPRLGGLSDIYVEQVMPIVKQNLAAWLRGDRAALVNHVRG